MAYDYLGLCNRVLSDFNEVLLTSSTFSAAVGFQNSVKNWINVAYYDICRAEDYEWPFLYASTTFTTVIGQTEYTKDAAAYTLDWDSFSINKTRITISSLTQTGGLATATTSAPHQLKTNDLNVLISGATQTEYNGYVTVTVTGASTFTYSVSSSAVSPATGSPVVTPPYCSKKLPCENIDTYRTTWLERDKDATSDNYAKPAYVVRKLDNNLILTPPADRIYTVGYDYFTNPTALSAYTDVPLVPSAFEQVIVDKVMQHAYMFRDNIEEAGKAEDNYTKGLNQMRRALIPQTSYMRFTD